MDAAELRERVLARELTWGQVELAAYVGDADALLACERARPPRELPRAAPERRWWPFRRRSPPGVDGLRAWARTLEGHGPQVTLRAGLAAARLTLPAWESLGAGRRRPHEALDALARWLDHGDAAALRRCAATLEAALALGVPRAGPWGYTLPVVLSVMVMSALEREEPPIALASILTAVHAALSGWLPLEAAADAAARSRAEGRRDYDVWQAEREAAAREEARLRREPIVVERIRRAAREALVPWALGPAGRSAAWASPGPRREVELEPLQPRAPRGVARRPRASPRSEVVADTLLGLVGVGPYGLVGAAAAALAKEARDGLDEPAPKPTVDDPDACWDCPRCRELNRNTTSVCRECGLRLV